MAAKYTKQTPQQVREWLEGQPLEFPAEWTLNGVAEEARRRNQAGRWSGTGIEASRAIARWGAYKLATSRDFTAAHWDWLTAMGSYSPMDLYNRLIRILEPAVGAGEAWRTTDAAKSKLLKEFCEKAAELLSIIEVERRLDVDFSDVVGLRPEMQPLLDRASEISRKRSLQIQAWTRAGRSEPLPPAEHPNFVGGPHLSDYLVALIAKITGTGQRAYPSLRSIVPIEVVEDADGESGDDEVDDLEIDPAEMSRLLGFDQGGPLHPGLLREGGDFGGAPARPDALLHAVIKAFPQALFDRLAPPPKVPPASAIEAACVAWFGKAPTQKEINARIKSVRAELEPRMERAINGYVRAEARRAAWRAEGLTEEEIRVREVDFFLGED